MKRFIGIFLIIALLCGLVACGKDANRGADPTAEPTEEPAATAEPIASDEPIVSAEPFSVLVWNGYGESTANTTLLSCDLNMDGTPENIAYDNSKDPDNFCDIYVGDAMITIEIFNPEAIMVFDLVEDDGALDLLISGDMCSCDYETYHLRYDDGKLTTLATVYGFLNYESTDKLEIYEPVELLGSWQAVRQYVPGEDGGIVPVGKELENRYSPETDEDWVVVKKDVPYTGANGAATLPVGTKLIPVKFNKDEFILWFVTSDGVEGEIDYTVSDDEFQWPRYIDGVEESEYFVELRYAG